MANQYANVYGWTGFLAALGLVSGILWLGWRIVTADPKLVVPQWLKWALIGAAVLRLAAGVVWFNALPRWGYDNPVNAAGYVMSDAHLRDTAAWKLAKSQKPLTKAFAANQLGDQYGGLLFISALVYRYLGGEVHQPLLIVVFTAAFSALAVLFTWAFARRAWDERVAGWSAGILALYPEAVLLGSSQMREAFLISLVCASFYGLVLYHQDHSWRGLVWLLGGVLLSLPFSPPAALLLLGMLALLAVVLEYRWLFKQHWLWLALGVLILLTLAGLWFTWGRLAPENITNPVELVGWWLSQTARWQAYFTKTASPVIKKIFKWTPSWFHLIILTAYGVLQPFLPAALLDNSSALWQGIAIWRSLGWTVLLAFLVYALIRALQSSPGRSFVLGLNWVVWIGIVLAAVRSGGDQWDNPRYRALFAGPQVALAAWAWLQQRYQPDPWLRRVLVGIGLFVVWFLVWYLQRNTGQGWTVDGVFKTIGLGLVSTTLYWLWDSLRLRRRR